MKHADIADPRAGCVLVSQRFDRALRLDAQESAANRPAGIPDQHTHVLNVRKKIERRPDAPAHLLTVHGVGYKLVL